MLLPALGSRGRCFSLRRAGLILWALCERALPSPELSLSPDSGPFCALIRGKYESQSLVRSE